MTTPVFNVEGQEAGTVTIRVQVQEADGTAADLTGYTGSIQVRPTVTSEDVLATGTVEFEAADGIVIATVGASETVGWTVGYYDVRIVDGDTAEYVVRGTITLHPSVTIP